MGKREERTCTVPYMAAAALLGGGLGALVALAVLWGCAAAISTGLIPERFSTHVVAAACVMGGFFGGVFTVKRWGRRRLFAGVAAGGALFCILMTAGLAVYGAADLDGQTLAVGLGCLFGGAAAGILRAGDGKKKRKK